MRKRDLRLKAIFIAATLVAAAAATLPFMAREAAAEEGPGTERFAVITASATRGDSNVEFIITGPDGRKLGFDPRTNDFREDMKGAYLRPWFWNADEGRAKLVPDPTDRGRRARRGPDTYTTFARMVDLEPGEYTVEVVGMGLTRYSIGILVSDADPDRSGRFHSAGVIDRGMSVRYRFSYSADGIGALEEAEKIVTTTSLAQEIIAFHRYDWIKGKGTARELLDRVEVAERHISSGNDPAAQAELAGFIDAVNGLSGRKMDSDGTGLLADDARKIAEGLCRTPRMILASSTPAGCR